MKKIWTFIDQKNWNAETKYRVASLVFGVFSALLGYAEWFVIGQRLFSGWDWTVCFIGYPVLISGFVVFLYSCNHGFHDGKHGKA